ncbi:MAG: MgtC/SapB family protein [Clostridia bacterium]
MVFEWEVVIRIVCAMIFGGLIGYEREYRKMPAGFRTHILVCVGAALVMVTSEFMLTRFSGIVNLDPARLGAQVISGIGFLGAGTILRDRFRVTGLTTAASLWAVACIGLAVGIGYYFMATIATLLIFGTLTFLRSFENSILCKITKSRTAITVRLMQGHEKEAAELIEGQGYRIAKIISFKSEAGKTQIKYELVCKEPKMDFSRLMEKMAGTDYIVGAELNG